MRAHAQLERIIFLKKFNTRDREMRAIATLTIVSIVDKKWKTCKFAKNDIKKRIIMCTYMYFLCNKMKKNIRDIVIVTKILENCTEDEAFPYRFRPIK